jgi:hypothetical protein
MTFFDAKTSGQVIEPSEADWQLNRNEQVDLVLTPDGEGGDTLTQSW